MKSSPSVYWHRVGSLLFAPLNQYDMPGKACSTRSIIPLLVSSGNSVATCSRGSLNPLLDSYITFRRSECEVQSWTNKESRFDSSWCAVCQKTQRSNSNEICWRFLDSTVWSAAVIRWTFELVHRYTMSWSFVALERSSDDGPDAST